MSWQDVGGLIGMVALCVVIVIALQWPSYNADEWAERWRYRETVEHLNKGSRQ